MSDYEEDYKRLFKFCLRMRRNIIEHPKYWGHRWWKGQFSDSDMKEWHELTQCGLPWELRRAQQAEEETLPRNSEEEKAPQAAETC